MSSTASTVATRISVFERFYDVVVCGAGCTGFAAARTLAQHGKQVLLLEASGDLLWEISRSLENTTDNDSPEWNDWLQLLRDRKGANEPFFDTALAEVLAADELHHSPPNLHTLLYATPFSVEKNGDFIVSATIATKSGFRAIRARQWIDASENATLARLTHPGQEWPTTLPTATYRSLVMQSAHWDQLQAPLARFLESQEKCEWLKSVRETERRLRWRAGEEAWHVEALKKISALRKECGAGPESFSVSLCSLRDFPVYATPPQPLDWPCPSNLLVLSPSWAKSPMTTPGDRFTHGARGIGELQDLPGFNGHTAASLPRTPLPRQKREADVVVAGTGTAGAVAALAASRQGVRTLAIDVCPYPGGIGTGGGITGYFAGEPGGLQEEINARTTELSIMMTGFPRDSRSWHHDAKKIALLELYDRAGVTFLGDAFVCGVERNPSGRIEHLIAVINGIPTAIYAHSFIDSTGDGDLAVLAGADFISGRTGDNRTLSFSQVAYTIGKAERGLNVISRNFDAGWVDATDAEDLSRARLSGMAQYLRPEWTADERPCAIAPLLGLRQSRHIVTDRQVTIDDLISHATFANSIGEMGSCADTHSVDFEFESDEMLFYYWVCRCFRHHLHSQLPYGMLLPKGLANLWIASRASGTSAEAAYALRMQRDMQRLGEAAGVAAGLAARLKVGARELDFRQVRSVLAANLEANAHRTTRGTSEKTIPSGLSSDDPLIGLDAGLPGLHLWQLYHLPETYRNAVRQRLTAANACTSFYAAAVFALWKNADAENRLLRAIRGKEIGPEPDPEGKINRGAFGQNIDLPFHMLAVALLRCCGTEKCLPVLKELAACPANPLNVRTIIALTAERLIAKFSDDTCLRETFDLLLQEDLPASRLPPSRSLWLTLEGHEQKKLGNDCGSDTRQDHSWQLHLIVARCRQKLGLVPQHEVRSFLEDERAYVRHAFEAALKTGKQSH